MTPPAASVAAAPVVPLPPVASVNAASPEKDAVCASLCERGKALRCPVDPASCRVACRQSLEPPCDAELTAALTCMTRESLAHWECSDEGLPVIRSGYCDAAQGKVAACMQRALGAANGP